MLPAALELAALAGGEADWGRVTRGDLDDLTVSTGQADEDVVDKEARSQYQQRVGDLDSKKRSIGLSPVEERELGDLRQHLRAALKIGGKPREISGQAERARDNVSHALRRSFEAIVRVLPQMAQHLDKHIKSGSFCSYEPDEPMSWVIER